MMYWYDHDLSGWGYAWMSIGMVVFWGLLIAAFVLVIRMVTRPDGATSTDDRLRSAEDLLAERFARGEIDAEEYASRLDTLRTHGGAVPRK
ncbi:SHOCT domain-containing protein [Nocardia sp. NPDC004278]|uniref:SHOCT domain-containing protein n=1 Tax=Nocardia sp. NPDC005998 TaxID=3156894 RepID=UPI0033B405FA